MFLIGLYEQMIYNYILHNNLKGAVREELFFILYFIFTV